MKPCLFFTMCECMLVLLLICMINNVLLLCWVQQLAKNVGFYSSESCVGVINQPIRLLFFECRSLLLYFRGRVAGCVACSAVDKMVSVMTFVRGFGSPIFFQILCFIYIFMFSTSPFLNCTHSLHNKILLTYINASVVHVSVFWNLSRLMYSTPLLPYLIITSISLTFAGLKS